MKKKFMKLVTVTCCMGLVAGMTACGADSTPAAKPVLYLYPEEEMEVSVKLDLDGELTSTWPKYDAKTGWDVLAKPDGTIVDKEGYEYSYLFWEAELNQEWDFSKGL